jgi:hypothetical protein
MRVQEGQNATNIMALAHGLDFIAEPLVRTLCLHMEEMLEGTHGAVDVASTPDQAIAASPQSLFDRPIA